VQAFRKSSGSLAMFAAIRANNATMDTARLPENVPIPTHTNSFVIFVVLCLLIFALMAFAKFMERRERKRLGKRTPKSSRPFQ
jgi:hypothetical protein